MRILKVFLGLIVSGLCSVMVYYVSIEGHRHLKYDVTSHVDVSPGTIDQNLWLEKIRKPTQNSFQESEVPVAGKVEFLREEEQKVADIDRFQEKTYKTVKQNGKVNSITPQRTIRTMLRKSRDESSWTNQMQDSMEKFVDFPEWYPPTLVNGVNINSNISRVFLIDTEEGKDPFVNHHRFSYSIDSNICIKRELFLIMVVHSAPDNYEKRRVVRETHGSVKTYKGRHIGVVFMIGQTDSWFADEIIKRESKRYGDIVQGNFHDHYRNLTKKHIMALHWYQHYCKSDYILKLDDDTFVNLFTVVEYLLHIKPNGRTVHCYIVKGQGPLRKPESKYYTPYSEYPFPILPYFCKGFAYLTTPETWGAMLSASQTTRVMSMDDVYVTGMLAMRSGVHHFTIEHLLNFCDSETEMRDMLFIWRGLGACGNPFQIITRWRELAANKTT